MKKTDAGCLKENWEEVNTVLPRCNTVVVVRGLWLPYIWVKCSTACHVTSGTFITGMLCWSGNHFCAFYFNAKSLVAAKIWCDNIMFYQIWSKYTSAVTFSLWGQISMDFMRVSDWPLWQLWGSGQPCYITNHGILSCNIIGRTVTVLSTKSLFLRLGSKSAWIFPCKIMQPWHVHEAF